MAIMYFLSAKFLISLILPAAYCAVVFGSLITFSRLYKKRKATAFATLAPWFPQHLSKDIYLSLLHLEPEPGKEKAPTVPESVLRAALLRRAVEDIHRIIHIRSAKSACATLLARGSVGDDLNERFVRAEQEMEAELRDVVTEANALAPNWGQTIFQSANEMAANAVFKNRIKEIEAKVPEDKEWWERRRASIQSELLKEEGITGSPVAAKAVSSEEDAILVEGGGPAAGSDKGSGRKKKGKK